MTIQLVVVCDIFCSQQRHSGDPVNARRRFRVEARPSWYRNGKYTSPQGTGGGCINPGPFANTTLHFKYFDGVTDLFTGHKLEHALHCLTRDLNNEIATEYNSQARIDDLLASPDIATFQSKIFDFTRDTSIMGLHNGGHYALGKDMHNQFPSPSDPVFYLHHAEIDNMYAQWQAKDLETR